MKMEGEMMDKRFHYYPFSHMIIDSMTGEKYDGNSKTCELLNQESDRADKLAEILYDDPDFRKLQWEKSIYEHWGNEVLKIMKKHDIGDLNKLDHILFYARTW